MTLPDLPETRWPTLSRAAGPLLAGPALQAAADAVARLLPSLDAIGAPERLIRRLRAETAEIAAAADPAADGQTPLTLRGSLGSHPACSALALLPTRYPNERGFLAAHLLVSTFCLQDDSAVQNWDDTRNAIAAAWREFRLAQAPDRAGLWRHLPAEPLTAAAYLTRLNGLVAFGEPERREPPTKGRGVL